jgi:hypothetical protein
VIRGAEESMSTSQLPLALNSLLNLAETLEEWQQMPIFLHLEHQLRLVPGSSM